MTKRNDVYGAIAMFFGVLILTILIVQAAGWFFDYLKGTFNHSQTIQVASAPETELPTASTLEAVSTRNLKTLVLNQTPYVPSPTVAQDLAVYRKESIKLIMSGDFKQANLHIRGKVTDKGIHFLDVVFGSNVGALYGVRYSANKFNITATEQNGGIFTNASAIDVTLDLLNPVQLSTTKAEFQKNNQAIKNVNLLPSNPLPPTYFSYLVAPFNAKGKFGGAEVSSTIEYSCVHDDDCLATRCSAKEPVAYCIRDIYGSEKALEWCKSVGYKCSFPDAVTNKN
jgi:hypothetical protein